MVPALHGNSDIGAHVEKERHDRPVLDGNSEIGAHVRRRETW